MPSIEHRMTEIYCFVDDFLKAHPALSGWRRSPHCSPRFTDAEVITIALLQGPLGVAKLKQTYDGGEELARGLPPPAFLRAVAQPPAPLTRQVGGVARCHLRP